MLELATGLKAYDKYRSEKKLLKEFVQEFVMTCTLEEIKDPLAGEEDVDVYDYFHRVGDWCTENVAERRPTMELIYKHIISYESWKKNPHPSLPKSILPTVYHRFFQSSMHAQK